MDPWLASAAGRVASAAGLDPGAVALPDADAEALLALASVAAHDSGARLNAPLLCYLVGRCEGASDRSLAELLAAVSDDALGRPDAHAD